MKGRGGGGGGGGGGGEVKRKREGCIIIREIEAEETVINCSADLYSRFLQPDSSAAQMSSVPETLGCETKPRRLRVPVWPSLAPGVKPPMSRCEEAAGDTSDTSLDDKVEPDTQKIQNLILPAGSVIPS
ncbi:unnamed protein product [Pleuronectes platessa]|uniref:Uncharacterized protein n=1 Tax=Pleuronectes platessa TaxID=8262 RepID=A0A9N7UZ62_PLEPL|nr:unnamed protein product [Pleuronectes platessa]